MTLPKPFRLPALLCLLVLAACQSPNDQTAADAASPNTATPPATASSRGAGNELRLLVDGKPWAADRDIHGYINPLGAQRSLAIGGSLGPKDANEQTFSIMLSNIDGPGRFHAKSGQGSADVVQLANYTPSIYLAGNLLGYDVDVEVTRFGNAPVDIEARFSGTLVAPDGSQLKITEGYYRYRE